MPLNDLIHFASYMTYYACQLKADRVNRLPVIATLPTIIIIVEAPTMKRVIVLISLVLLLIDKGSSQGGASCNEDGDFQLTYNFTATPYKNAGDYVKEFRGLLEICYNGTFYGVCSGSYNKQQLAELVCSSLGYDNGIRQ